MRRIMERNAERLLPDLQTLIHCGGTVYISGNRTDESGELEFGHIVPSIDVKPMSRDPNFAPERELTPPRRTQQTTRLNTQRLRDRLASLDPPLSPGQSAAG